MFFALGFASYALIPNLGHLGNVALFVAAFCIILSMYGGGFATVPAHLADLFGTQMVGAIHGRLLALCRAHWLIPEQIAAFGGSYGQCLHEIVWARSV